MRGINRREFLKIFSAAGSAALFPDATHLARKLAENIRNGEKEWDRNRMALELLEQYPKLNPFSIHDPGNGESISIASPPTDPDHRNLLFLPGFRPRFLTSRHSGVFTHLVSPPQLASLTKQFPGFPKDLIQDSFVIDPRPESTKDVVLILGDSHTLWRGWTFFLQLALSQSGKNTEVRVSADYGTGPLEAYQRLSYYRDHGEVTETSLLHLLSPATDFTKDMDRSPTRTPPRYPQKSIATIVATSIRSEYREAASALDLPIGSGSYIFGSLNQPENKKLLSEAVQTLRKIRGMNKDGYRLVGFGDSSIVNRADMKKLNELYEGLCKEIDSPLEKLFSDYPSSQLDQMDHITDEGALIMAVYFFKLITGEDLTETATLYLREIMKKNNTEMDKFLRVD